MNKNSFATLLLTLLLSMMSTNTFAYDAEVDGIYYNLIKGKVAEVTYMIKGNNNKDAYSGNVVIPEKVTYEGVEYPVDGIGENAFYKCSGLTSITIPNSVTSIGNEAFSSCSGLTSISIPNSVTSIGERAFEGCSGLTSFTIPNSVTYIGQASFYNCYKLTSIIIPNGVTSIGKYAFEGCSGLTSITIPNSVTSIGELAFEGCSGLTSITIPNSVTNIEHKVFSGCRSLTSITLPNSVTSIGYSAFENCFALTSITIPSSVTWIGGYAFDGCSSLTSITLPNSVTSISEYAFRYCSGLTSITIPNSVTSIEERAFEGCTGLASITLPNRVTYIGGQAFANCSKLEEVYCYAEKVPSTNTSIFQNSYPNYATLYVPASTINDYKTTEPWSQFGTIKTIEGTIPETKKCATPTISYGNKVLTFSCETEGVEYVYEIKDTDIKKGYDAKVSLSATYNISVYATKSGYENSDVATATLVWTEADFTVTTPTSAKAVKESVPVLISANNGMITVKGELDGQAVTVYSAEGKLLGSDSISGGQATISTSLNTGSVAIVKIGQRAVKVVIR